MGDGVGFGLLGPPSAIAEAALSALPATINARKLTLLMFIILDLSFVRLTSNNMFAHEGLRPKWELKKGSGSLYFEQIGPGCIIPSTCPAHKARALILQLTDPINSLFLHLTHRLI